MFVRPDNFSYLAEVCRSPDNIAKFFLRPDNSQLTQTYILKIVVWLRETRDLSACAATGKVRKRQQEICGFADHKLILVLSQMLVGRTHTACIRFGTF
jgi:hypothetical protein